MCFLALRYLRVRVYTIDEDVSQLGGMAGGRTAHAGRHQQVLYAADARLTYGVKP